MNHFKRILSFILVLVLLAGMVPPVEGRAAQVVQEEVLQPAAVQEEKTEPRAAAAVSRAQWLSLLVQTFGYAMDSDVTLDNYYPDLSSEADYYTDVMTAVYYGLVDILPNGQLRPDDPATREFAAATLNSCMGYLPEEEPSFSEAAAVTCPDDLQVAIERGWFALSGDAVLPEQPITEAEQQTMLADAESYVDELELPEENPGSYTFKEGVVEILDYAEIDSDGTGSVIRIYDISQPLEVGDTFVVYSGDLAIPFRADAISANADFTQVTATDLFFEDAIESMDVQTATEADPLNYYANEDTDLVFIEEDTGAVVSAEYASWAMARGTTKLYFPKYSAKLELGEAMTLSVDVELKNAKLVNKTKVKGTIGETSIYLDTDVEQNVKLSCELTKLGSDGIEIPLGGYDVDGIGGLDISLKIDVTGAISIVQKGHLKAGVKFSFNLLKMKFSRNLIYKYVEKGSSINAEISAKVCLEAKFGVYGKALPVKGYFYGEVGFLSNVQRIEYDEIIGVCTHFAAHLYAEAGAKAEVKLLGVENSWSYSKEFYKESNSPVKISAHYEDGIQVPACTREDQEGTATGTSSAYKEVGYTTSSDSSYSGSGLASGGSSKSYNTAGEPVIVYTYSLDTTKNATITGYSGNATSLTIPQKLDGYDVVAIGKNAFKGKLGLKSVIMQDNILSIGESAFQNCSNLRNLVLSENLTAIGVRAFEGCSTLTKVDMPDSVTAVYAFAFAECANLQYVRLSRGLTELTAAAFKNCDKLTSIEIPRSLANCPDYFTNRGPFAGCDNLRNVTFEEGVTVIPRSLFAHCPGLTSIVLPDTVTGIAPYAFSNALNLETVTYSGSLTYVEEYSFQNCDSLTEAVLPEGVTFIGVYAYENCGNLETVYLPDSVTAVYAFAFAECAELKSVRLSRGLTELTAAAFKNCDKLTTIEIPKSLANCPDYFTNRGPFAGCDNLSNVTFEEGVTVIPRSLFAHCTGLTSIVIPDTVTGINPYAFSNALNLETVTYSNRLTYVEEYAFQNCDSLTEVILPDGVTFIGVYAYENCGNLETVYLPDSVTSVYAFAFAECSELKSVRLSRGLTELTAAAFKNCDKLTTIEIPKSLENCPDYFTNRGPFAGCDSLTEVTFEEGVTVIPRSLFAHCTGLTSIVIPDTVTGINPYAFSNAMNLETVTHSKNLSYVEEYAFQNCDSLTEAVLPDGVTFIGMYAYEGCGNLENVYLPDSVTAVYAFAFAECGELKSLRLSHGLTELTAVAFKNCDKLTTVEIPKSLTSCPDYFTNHGPFSGCDGLASVTFEEGITQISANLFANCTGLASVEIPATVTVIGNNAFQNCPNLAVVTFPESLTSIGERAFQNAASLKEVVIPDSVTTMGKWVFEFATGLESVTWSAGMTAIPQRTFNGCTALTAVNLPDTLVSMGEGAFRDCSALASFTMPDSVTTLDTYTFYGCTALEQIELSENLTSVPNYTFQNCDALTSLEIPDRVTAIGSNAFYDCDALVSVTMGDNVTSMGTYAFYHCDALENVELSMRLPKIPANTFQNCAKLAEITIPYYATAIEANAFNASPKLAKVVTRSNLTSIAANAFSYPAVTVFYGDAGSYTETWAGNNGYRFTANAVPATEVTLSQTAITLAKGKTAVLGVTVTPADHSDAVTYKSSKTDVATVDASGKVTAVGVGTTTIKVTVGSVSASCKITVTQSVTGLTLNRSSLALQVPGTFQLVATVKPADASNPVLLWTSSNEAAATVDENGLITAVGNGTAVITAATTDGTNLSRSCTVTVTDPNNIPVSKITLNKTTASLDALQTLQLTATVAPTNAANPALAWTSSDEAVATVDGTGLVTALAKGTAIITAAATDESGVTAVCTVTVLNTAHVVTDPAQLESPHDYPVNCTDFWVYTAEGAASLNVTFDALTSLEEDFDFLHIYDGEDNLVGTYTGTALAEQTVTVPGDTVKIRLESDDSGTEWGFRVSGIEAVIEEIRTELKILTQPESVTVAAGETAEVSFLAEGDGLTYEWYFANPGKDTFSVTSAFITNVYSVSMSAARDGRRVYCIVTDAYGNSLQTETVSLNMLKNEATILTQPESVTVAAGEIAEVSFLAEGDGLTYEWYFANPGSSKFSATTTFTSNVYSVTMSAARDGRRVYCIVSDAYGNSVKTDTVTLNMVRNEVKLLTQPESVTVAAGEIAEVSFLAEGDGLTYEWYYANPGKDTFTATTAFTSNVYSVIMSAARHGRRVYCIVTDAYGNSVQTDTVTLSMVCSEVKILQQPESVIVAEGEKATVTFTAEGDDLTYEWYYANPGSSKFTATTAFTSNTYSVTMSAARSGRQVYCIVTDAYGNSVKTDTVTLEMNTERNELKILTQPKSVWVAKGKTAVVTVEAEGDGLTYKWYFKNPGASKYTYTSTFTGNTYSVAMSAERSGRYVYCVVTDAYGNSEKTKTVSVNMQTPLEILTQPVSKRVASGAKATVTVKAQGDGLTYKWYYKNPGDSEYTYTSAFTGNSYSITMTAARNGRYVYCRVYDKYGNSVKTNTVSLRMK